MSAPPPREIGRSASRPRSPPRRKRRERGGGKGEGFQCRGYDCSAIIIKITTQASAISPLRRTQILFLFF